MSNLYQSFHPERESCIVFCALTGEVLHYDAPALPPALARNVTLSKLYQWMLPLHAIRMDILHQTIQYLAMRNHDFFDAVKQDGLLIDFMLRDLETGELNCYKENITLDYWSDSDRKVIILKLSEISFNSEFYIPDHLAVVQETHPSIRHAKDLLIAHMRPAYSRKIGLTTMLAKTCQTALKLESCSRRVIKNALHLSSEQTAKGRLGKIASLVRGFGPGLDRSTYRCIKFIRDEGLLSPCG